MAVDVGRAAALAAERRSLPIFSAREALIREIKANMSCVVMGETGSGKTTQIPQVGGEEVAPGFQPP